jgi:hypothetical protein
VWIDEFVNSTYTTKAVNYIKQILLSYLNYLKQSIKFEKYGISFTSMKRCLLFPLFFFCSFLSNHSLTDHAMLIKNCLYKVTRTQLLVEPTDASMASVRHVLTLTFRTGFFWRVVVETGAHNGPNISLSSWGCPPHVNIHRCIFQQLRLDQCFSTRGKRPISGIWKSTVFQIG